MSYLVPYDSIPGRMSLIVTVLLALINTLIKVSGFAPGMRHLTALEIYMIISIIQVRHKFQFIVYNKYLFAASHYF